MSFPRYVYRVPGPRKRRGVPAHDRLLVEDAEALEASKKAGWSASVEEASESPEPTKEVPLKRAELEAEATRLGLKYDGRNSDERLAERILEAMNAKEV